MMKSLFKIYTALLFFLFGFNSDSQSFDKIWNELHSNNRAKALDLVNNTLEENEIEALILKKIVGVENGLLRFDKDFLKNISEIDDFEYYLFALWNQPFMMDDYLENGFHLNYSKILESINKQNISNPTIADGYKYLSAVVSRYYKDWEGYSQYIESIPSISDWEYCGVFENINLSGIDIPYPPESDVNSDSFFDAQSNGLSNWYFVGNKKNEVYNFMTNHDEFGSGVHYAQTFIELQDDRRLKLDLGKSGKIKVWVNDVLVIDESEVHITELDAINYELNFQKGVNRILVKLAADTTPYFILRLTNIDGSDFKDFDYSFENREYLPSSISTTKSIRIEHPVEKYFESRLDFENGDYFLNTYCLFYTYLRNGKVDKALNLMLPEYEQNRKSSFLASTITSAYEMLNDDTTINQINRNILQNDPEYYLSFLLEYQDFDALMKLDYDEYVNKLNKLKKCTDLPYIETIADLLIYVRQSDLKGLRKSLDLLMKDPLLPSGIYSTFAEFYTQVFNDDSSTIKALEFFNERSFNWTVITYLDYYYEKQDKLEKANRLFKEHMKYLGYDNNLHYYLIQNLHQEARYQESLKYIDQALENFPNSYLFMKLKGEALLQLDRKNEAIICFETALSKNPSDTVIRQKIADLTNTKNPLFEFELANFYSYIDENRSKIKSNNYGVNILLSQFNILGYERGGAEYKSTLIYEITSQNGIDIFKEYDLNLGGDYLITKSEIVKVDGQIIPADRNGSQLVFDQLELGDVILINYASGYNSTGRFYNDNLLYHNFDGYHPTLKNVYRFITPLQSLDFDDLSPSVEYKISKLDKWFVHEWTLENSPGLPIQENYMPPFNDVVTRLNVSTIDSWNEIGNWYSDLVRNQLRTDDLVIEVYNQLFPNGTKNISEKNRAKIIYNYITENFNYSYVNFRQSGFVPQKPSKTIKTKLGDCKDLSSLFLVLGELAGLDVNLVLILTSDYGKRNIIKPSTDFNHCIVKVRLDGESYYLELTDKNLPFLSLPASLREAAALDIPKKNGDLRSELYFLESDNRTKAKFLSSYTLLINEDESFIDLDQTIQGHAASYYIGVFNRETGELLEDTLFEELNNRTAASIELKKFESYELSEDDILNYKISLSLDLEINKIAKYYTFKAPTFLNPYNENIIELKERNYPIDYIQYETSDSYEEHMILEISKEYKFVELPEDKIYTFKDHKFSISYELIEAHRLKIKINSKVNSDDISAKDYLEFKAYVEAVLDTKNTILMYEAL